MNGKEANTGAGVYRSGVPVPRQPVNVAVERGMLKRWVMRGAGGDGTLIERVLRARGLDDPLAAAEFLDPKLTGLHEPSLMAGMDRAAERLLGALDAGEPVAIYGDYDVDGVTATAILYRMLKHLRPGADVRTYVPHRLDEGYGLNSKAVEGLAGQGVKVIVSVDCGVTAIEPALLAKRLGVDLIVTDHHNPPESVETLPAAYAVVHPRYPGGAYPFGDLSGAGVAYKLAWKLAVVAGGGAGRLDQATRGLLVNLLALAALGAIADVVPLVGENRIIAKHGLTRIRSSPFIGLRALAEAARLTGDKVSEWDVGFRLAPRLNAGGRMGHAKDAIELFITEDADRARQIAEGLEAANAERRAVELEIVKRAEEMAKAAGMTGDSKRAIVLAHESWHAGVVGICCSRLVDRYCRPTILMQIDGDECHGSGRSIDGYNLHAGIAACAEHVTRFGGHDMAAGVHVEKKNLEAFTEAFTAHAGVHIGPEQLTHVVPIDAEAAVGEVDLATIKRLLLLQPFGRGNPGLKLVLREVVIAADPRPFGDLGVHLELQVGDGRGRMKLTGWRWGQHRSRLARGVRIDALIEPKIDTYGGERAAGELIDVRVLA